MTALAGERIFCERWYVVRYLLAVRGQVLAQAERVYDSTYRTIYYWGVVRRTVSAKYTGKAKDWDPSQAESNSYDKTRQITINGGDQQDGYYFFYFISFYLFLHTNDDTEA